MKSARPTSVIMRVFSDAKLDELVLISQEKQEGYKLLYELFRPKPSAWNHCKSNRTMLNSLFIRNFVLIDSLDIQFDKGFSVITGETGAGKSIILGALSLVLGQRADGKSIKKGADKCVIEVSFDISKYQLEHFSLKMIWSTTLQAVFCGENSFLPENPVLLSTIHPFLFLS